jgi:hypothetical protein
MNFDGIDRDAALSRADAAAGNSHRAPSPQDVDWDVAGADDDDRVPDDDGWVSDDDDDCGPDGPPFYPIDDVRTWSVDDVRARAQQLLGIRAYDKPEDYQRIADCLDKRGVITHKQLNELVEAQLAKNVNEFNREQLAAQQRELLNAPDDTGALKVLYLDTVASTAEPNDFVEGLLCDGQSSVLFGDANVGKSFLALDLAMHVALGWSWHGRDVERGGVVYVAAEGGGGMKRRIDAFRQHHGLERTADAALAIIPETIDFRDGKSVKAFIRQIPEIAERLGVPVRLIIIDTLSRALAGGNENAPDDMGAFVRNVDRVRTETGAHVTAIHHCGKDDSRGARGHSLLRAAVDTEIKVERPEGPHGPTVACVTKQRDLEIGGPFIFGLRKVELGTDRRGKPVTSCVVETAVRKPLLSEAEQEAVKILNTMLFESPATTVPIAEWRKAIMSGENILTGPTPDTRGKQWQRLRDRLKKLGVIEISGTNVGLRKQ